MARRARRARRARQRNRETVRLVGILAALAAGVDLTRSIGIGEHLADHAEDGSVVLGGMFETFVKVIQPARRGDPAP